MRARHGFVLVLVIVAIAVMMVASAAIAPSLMREMNDVRIGKAVAELENIWSAVAAFDGDVNRSPGSLIQLSQAITLSNTDVCGNNYNQGQVNGWAGPYWTRNPSSDGLKVRIGTLLSAPDRSPDMGGPQPELMLVVTGVTIEDAVAVNRRIDPEEAEDGPTADDTAGVIRWNTPDAEGLVTLRYAQPVTGGCGGSGGGSEPPADGGGEDPGETGSDPAGGTGGGPSITLDASGYISKNQGYVNLAWYGSSAVNVDVYRNGAVVTTTANDGVHTDGVGKQPAGTYTYKICEFGTATCSAEVSVTF